LEALRISSGDLLLLSVHPFHPFFESGDPPKYIRSPSVGRRAFPEPLVEEVLPWTLLAEINVSACLGLLYIVVPTVLVGGE